MEWRVAVVNTGEMEQQRIVKMEVNSKDNARTNARCAFSGLTWMYFTRCTFAS